MKIKDLPYKRSDFEQIAKQLNEITEKFKQANCVEQAINLRKDMQMIVEEFSTMASLANIRFTQNTKDEFYLQEKKYYDEKFPLFYDVYTKFMDSDKMKAYEAARAEIDNLMNYLMQILGLCVNGADPATCEPEVPEEHSCGGSCSSCSGCH